VEDSDSPRVSAALPTKRLTRFGAWLIRASTAIDNGYRRYDRLRSELVAGLASDAVLDRFNEIAYGQTQAYRPDAPDFRAYLFPWEESVVRERFPQPPARILVGGAGGGREPLALAAMGFEVVAFEPAEPLISALAQRAPWNVTALRGAYDDMPALFPEGESFDAAVVGWGSFSHLRNERSRIETLRSFARLTRGPILVSFLAVKTGRVSPGLSRLRRFLPRRPNREAEDIFAVSIGFYHPVDEDDVLRLADAAGLEIEHLSFDQRDTNWPHVVLRRRE
jgi:2-polyprenyl-3-methyl-5-hydroxy-6-metoxy-1,4-benzoquinol methylase